MISVLNIAAVREVERAADAGGISYRELMERAGTTAAARIAAVVRERGLNDGVRITVLVGAGNNGGDGLVAARVLAEQLGSGALVRCYLTSRREEDDAVYAAARDAGLFMANAEDDQRYRVLLNMVASAHVVVDALFGIGVRLPLEGEIVRILRAVEQGLNAPGDEEPALITPGDAGSAARTPYVVALDCPSGVDCDTGAADAHTLSADETITFIAAKPGLFVAPAAARVGRLHVATLSLPPDTPGLDATKRRLATADAVRRMLPARPDAGHKGTFGRVLIVGGSVNYSGAPGLAAEGAYRVGAGLVTVGAPAGVVAALAAQRREPTWIVLPNDLGVIAASAADLIRAEMDKIRALVIGMGVGREKTTGEMLMRLLTADATTGKRAIGFGAANRAAAADMPLPPLPPLVIDADGLYLLGQTEQWWTHLPAETILTPHPGEIAHLLGTTTDEVQARRWDVAAEAAARWNAYVVLKGAYTLVAAPDGNVTAIPFATAALATAGTGDVLAGMIGGLLAQGMTAHDAAVAGAYLHGLAGQMLSTQIGSRGTLAGDVATFGISQALRAVTGA